MSVLSKDDPDHDCSWQLYFECLLPYFYEQDELEQKRKRGEYEGPRAVRFTKGPDYGDGCYNIAGNIDLRELADRIIKFVRERRSRCLDIRASPWSFNVLACGDGCPEEWTFGKLRDRCLALKLARANTPKRGGSSKTKKTTR